MAQPAEIGAGLRNVAQDLRLSELPGFRTSAHRAIRHRNSNANAAGRGAFKRLRAETFRSRARDPRRMSGGSRHWSWTASSRPSSRSRVAGHVDAHGREGLRFRVARLSVGTVCFDPMPWPLTTSPVERVRPFQAGGRPARPSPASTSRRMALLLTDTAAHGHGGDHLGE